jgi:hypothetical protein
LPASVIEAVANHHLPARELSSEFNPLTAVHLANALENAITKHAATGQEPVVDLDYPTELRVIEQLDTFREIVLTSANAKSSSTQFIRRVAVPEKPSPALSPNVQAASETAPNGFWSRFRSLLAT